MNIIRPYSRVIENSDRASLTPRRDTACFSRSTETKHFPYSLQKNRLAQAKRISIMADSLKIGNLSLNDSQHAPNPPSSGRAAYIPPHLRQRNVNPMSVDGAAPPPAAPPANAGPTGWGPGYVLFINVNRLFLTGHII